MMARHDEQEQDEPLFEEILTRHPDIVADLDTRPVDNKHGTNPDQHIGSADQT